MVMKIKKILNNEMNDIKCNIFKERISRLVNSLNGFYPDIKVRYDENEHIENIIVKIKEQLGYQYTIEKHKQLFKK